ncbi:MAG: hydantoinase B/oxoprolinase family protein, partial [Chloroflexi bacterium]|nr:hydantoinase B/oxoprolinase family protein [Chloroflexota bacterium]
GYGGSRGRDGLGPVDTLFANTRNNPIEDIEAHLPLRVLRYELREDSAGPGRWRGAPGSIREMQYLVEGGMSMEADGHKYPPPGLFGGKDGKSARLEFISGGKGEATNLISSKIPWRLAGPGDVYRTVSPSGGGYGNPMERDPQAVLDDVLDEIVSVELARDQYGVVIDTTKMRVDLAATGKLRRELSRSGS